MDNNSNSKIQDLFQKSQKHAVAAGWASLVLGLFPLILIFHDIVESICCSDYIWTPKFLGLPIIAAIIGIFSLSWINRSILQFSHFARPPLAILIISVLGRFSNNKKWYGISEVLSFILGILFLFLLIVVFDLVVKSVKQKKQKAIPALIGITLAVFEMVTLI